MLFAKEQSAARRAANQARAALRPHRRVRARARRPGTRYKLTRRTLERRFFLNPCKRHREKLNELVGYLLGYFCASYEILLHAAAVASNHPHIDCTDENGDIGEFKAAFYGTLARAVNAMLGRNDRFWSSDGGCDTEPVTDLVSDDGEAFPSSPLADLVYTLTNPVKDGLVKNGGRWPGFTTYGWKFGETRTFRRPDWFFTPGKTTMPETVELTLHRPKDVLPELDDHQVYAQLMREVKTREKYFQRRVQRENRRFLGEQKIEAQSWKRVAESENRMFTVTPKVVGATKWERMAGIQRDKQWEADYAEAYERFLAGDRDVEFPFGTDWMRKYACVKVRPPP